MNVLSNFLKFFCIALLLTVFSACSTVKFTSSSTPDSNQNTSHYKRSESIAKINIEAARKFAKQNFKQIRNDSAVGKGEYLSSLSFLMGVPEHHQTKFSAHMKQNFSSLFNASENGSDELIVMLEKDVLSDAYLRR